MSTVKEAPAWRARPASRRVPAGKLARSAAPSPVQLPSPPEFPGEEVKSCSCPPALVFVTRTDEKGRLRASLESARSTP